MTDDPNSRLPPDAELLEQLRDGDSRALTALFEAYFDMLVRFAYGYVKSRDTAKDVVQDVFVHLWEAPEVFAPARSLKQFLYAAVRNRALNERKRAEVRARHQAVAMAEMALDPDRGATPSPEGVILEAATVQVALEQLPERRREALRLHLGEQLTMAEIGEVLGISAVAAERLVYRALAELRKILRLSGTGGG